MRTRQSTAIETGGRGELALLERLRRRSSNFGSAALPLGIGDDCALIRLRPGEEMAITTDLSIAGRHFRLEWHPPESVGHRTLARGLSDLAAMGAKPLAAFLSLGLPRELTHAASSRNPFSTSRRVSPAASPAVSWMDRFLDGFFALAAASHTPLAGGDLAESPVAVADIVLAGTVPRGRALLRSRARPGDRLYVTGSLGGATAGLAHLARLEASAKSPSALAFILEKHPDSLAPHLYPQPRVAQGRWFLQKGPVTAAIDLSDGLSTDLTHLCDESGVAAEVDAAAIPVHPAATMAQALDGGEDYELLFTAPAAARLPRSIAGVPITLIGRIVPRRSRRPSITLITPNGREPLVPHGWEHFV